MRRITFYIGLGGVPPVKVQQAKAMIGDLCGGYTWMDTAGHWNDVTEGGAMVVVFGTSEPDFYRDVAQLLTIGLGQSEVWLTDEPLAVTVVKGDKR